METPFRPSKTVRVSPDGKSSLLDVSRKIFASLVLNRLMAVHESRCILIGK